MPTTVRTVIVDDETLAVERLGMLCARLAGVEVVGTASEGAAALRLIADLRPAMLLLDIAMPGMDGMQLARALAKVAAPPAVVFVTAFAEFAVAAFEIAATDYLLKPVSLERLRQAADRVRDRLETGAGASPAMPRPWLEEFWVPHRSEIVRIAAADIDLIEAERDYMRLHIGVRSYLLHRTIGELERQLDPKKFVRLHRSTIVSRDRITGFSHDRDGTWAAHIRGGRTVRVGRSYLKAARSLLAR